LRRAGALAAFALIMAVARATLATDASAPDAPTVTARADRRSVRVGDVVTVTVAAVAPRTVPVNLPAQPDLGPFALLDRRESEVDLGDGRKRREFVLRVAAYEPGDQTLPGVELTYIGATGAVLTVRSEPITVQVRSLLANEPDPALKDNVGPIAVYERNRYLVGGLAALAAVAVGMLIGVAVLRRVRARAAIRPAPPPRPAHEVALERLDRLASGGFAEDADYRPFTFAMSEIVREYLGARFGFESLELTTEELVTELRRRAGRELIFGEVEGWLSGCDLVKFAKLSPSAAEARGAFELALRIVAATRPRPEPQVAPGSLPPAAEEGARG
jgi:hypothetical protein